MKKQAYKQTELLKTLRPSTYLSTQVNAIILMGEDSKDYYARRAVELIIESIETPKLTIKNIGLAISLLAVHLFRYNRDTYIER